MRKSWRPLKYHGPPLQPPSARICRGIHDDWAHARWGNSAIRRGTHHGVVFRVGTPGRLAGRCLWPSLSSRKSKATGVVVIPFSSISPFYHLLRFLPSFYFHFFFFRFFSFSPSVLIFLLLSLLITTFSRGVELTSLNFFLWCASRWAHTCRQDMGGCCNSARVKTTKKKVKVLQFRQFVASLVHLAAFFRRYIFWRLSRVEGSSSDLDRWAISECAKCPGRAPADRKIVHRMDQPSVSTAPVKLPSHVSNEGGEEMRRSEPSMP